jgi:pyruvate dehydrogenase E2 component (dihydrolipoamide acetyltransferase)
VVNAQPASQAAVAPVQAVVSKQDRVVPISSMRASIAKRLTQSKEVAPHFYLTMVIDMDKAAEFRANLNSLQSEVKVSFNDMIVKAAARALTKHPYVNGSYLDDKMVLYGRVDIGVAVALEEGLITPVVRNADSRSILEIAQDIRDLARKAKERKLTPAEYSGSTFTISNLGMYDIKQFTAIINPPEAAILAVGAVQQRPVVRDGQIVVGQQMEVTLTCDHRIVDGATGALFLREFKKNLENPLSLMLNN